MAKLQGAVSPFLCARRAGVSIYHSRLTECWYCGSPRY